MAKQTTLLGTFTDWLTHQPQHHLAVRYYTTVLWQQSVRAATWWHNVSITRHAGTNLTPAPICMCQRSGNCVSPSARRLRAGRDYINTSNAAVKASLNQRQGQSKPTCMGHLTRHPSKAHHSFSHRRHTIANIGHQCMLGRTTHNKTVATKHQQRVLSHANQSTSSRLKLKKRM